MAMLNESNLLAMKAKAAKFRTHHVGTKLNEAELHEFEALAEKRGQSPSELIRGLVLGEIERDKHPPRASVELEEIATCCCRFMLNLTPIVPLPWSFHVPLRAVEAGRVGLIDGCSNSG